MCEEEVSQSPARNAGKRDAYCKERKTLVTLELNHLSTKHLVALTALVALYFKQHSIKVKRSSVRAGCGSRFAA